MEDDEEGTLKRTRWLKEVVKKPDEAKWECLYLRGLIPASLLKDNEEDKEESHNKFALVSPRFGDIAADTKAIYTDGGGAPRWVITTSSHQNRSRGSNTTHQVRG